jgi:hypothetical protein
VSRGFVHPRSLPATRPKTQSNSDENALPN